MIEDLMFAYLPARGGSKRIKRKNIIDVEGKPMITHTLDSLMQVSGLRGIAVSTDDEEIAEICSMYKGVTCLEMREKELASDDATLVDLIRKDLPRFCNHFKANDVLMVLPTAIFVGPQDYNNAINIYNEKNPDLVISVTKTKTNGMLSLVVDDFGSITPLFPESYKLPTSKLPHTFIDSGSFYIFNQFNAAKCELLLSLEFRLGYELPVNVGVDIDNLEDLHVARSLMNQKKSGELL